MDVPRVNALKSWGGYTGDRMQGRGKNDEKLGAEVKGTNSRAKDVGYDLLEEIVKSRIRQADTF